MHFLTRKDTVLSYDFIMFFPINLNEDGEGICFFLTRKDTVLSYDFIMFFPINLNEDGEGICFF